MSNSQDRPDKDIVDVWIERGLRKVAQEYKEELEIAKHKF